MASEWEKTTIEAIASRIAMGPFGSDIKTDNFVSEGVPVIRGGNLTSGRFNSDNFVFLTEEKADSLINANAFPDDIVFTHRGTLGQVGIIPKKPYERYVVSQSQMKLTCNPAITDSLFIYYFFKSSIGQHALLMNTSQTGVPAISRPVTSLKNIQLILPSLKEQKNIAYILGTLDDKIELNRKMNETLEAMARALFKSWFVDFDPVRAKMEGRWKRGQSLPGLPTHLYDLFPSEFQNSELGKIPKGWNLGAFAITVEIIGGGTPKTSEPSYWNGTVPWFSVVDAPVDSDIWIIDTEKKITQSGVENSSAQILSVGTTIISARGTVGRVGLVGVPMAMNQSCYGLRGKLDKNGYYTYFSTRQLVSELRQHAHGSVFDTITRDTFEGVKLAIPRTVVVEKFEEIVKSILTCVLKNLIESQHLTQMRDLLLPKLISGELRVPTASTK